MGGSTYPVPPPPNAPPPPGKQNPPPPVPADEPVTEGEDVEKCEGCEAIVPEGTLRETDDMVILCPECMKICAEDEPAEDAHRNQVIISENFGGGIMDEGDSEPITEREIPVPKSEDL